MSRVSLPAWIGATLLTAVFGLAVWNMAARTRVEGQTGKTVLRFAHTHLEAGVREAFDAMAREYSALHPHVVVEQIAIPRRAWAAWMQTQLVGGTAPDLLHLVNNDHNPIARHFRPIDAWMSQPNPYNEGTPLAGRPWGQTFIAPLAEPPTYWPLYMHHYGVPTTVFTMRLYYNRALLREITGSDRTPKTFAEFTALCRQVQAWSANRSEPFYPIAAARPTPPSDVLFNRLFSMMSQTLVETIDRTRSLGGGTSSGGELRALARDAAMRGLWDPSSPHIQAGLSLVKDVGQYFQPGFLQADREEAMFYFLQGRALMMMSGSWDYGSLASQAQFDLGVFRLPEPDAQDPVYGRFVLGPMSEADAVMRGAFAVTQTSRNPDLAVDFLRYVTSQRAHARFAELSGWLPVVRGVEPAEEIRGFSPVTSGYPAGFIWTVGVETVRLSANFMHLLFGSSQGVQAYTEAMAPLWKNALVLDEQKEQRETVHVLLRYDTQSAVDQALRHHGETPSLTADRRSELHESQHFIEYSYLRALGLIQGSRTPDAR